MSAWQLAHVNQILLWAEHGQLNAQQVAKLEALAPLRSSRTAWLLAGERFCTFAAALLLSAAVVFFFAYNWDGMHRFAKLGLVAGALTACAAAALASRPGGIGWQSALFGAAACTGALLALIGQIYQTGADIWELFVVWTALMLPFVLLARALATWLLCLLVSNAGLTRMLWQDGALWQLGVESDAAQLAVWLAFNTLWWLAAWHGGRWMLTQPSRYLERTAAALALAALTVGAVLGVSNGKLGMGFSHFVGYVPLFIAVAGAGFWFYRHRRLDIVMLGMLSVCSVMTSTSVLARLFLFEVSVLFDVSGLFVIAVFVVAVSGFLSVWLKNLYRRQHQQEMAAAMRASDVASLADPVNPASKEPRP